MGKEKAKTLVSFVEAKVDEGLKDKASVFGSKEGIQMIRADIQSQINKVLIWLKTPVFPSAGIIIACIKFL